MTRAYRVTRSAIPSLALLLASSAHAQPGSTSALLNQALDKPVTLEINAVLPRVMREIADSTGVRIEADPAIWDMLPWGEETEIKASISNRTLRESLAAIIRSLGLTFVLRENAVALLPTPALARMGKRATLQEVELLNLLAANPFRADNARPTLRQILEAVDAQLMSIKADFVVENRAPQGQLQETLIPLPRNASLADALEAIARSTGMTWIPIGKTVVVLPKEDQIRAILQKPVTLNLRGDDVGQVLLDLSRQTGVPFAIEPGAVQRVPPEFRSVRLSVDNAPVQQILESLAATTGLGYVVSDKVSAAGPGGGGGGVYIWNNSPIPFPPPMAADRPAPARISLLIPLTDGTQLVLPESDLPEDVQQFLRQKRDAEVERLRGQMKKENFTPTTRPAERREDL